MSGGHPASLALRACLAGLKLLIRALCRIDSAQLSRVPARGPLILVTNHINILEVPLLYLYLLPRPVTCFVASNRWENPFFRWLLNGLDMIPLHRGQADLNALRQGLRRLDGGDIVIIAPEGTRSRTGQLQRAKAGVIVLAAWSRAPMLPLVYFGHESFPENVRRLRRTDFHIAVGEPFLMRASDSALTKPVRQAMLNEVMERLAILLPPANRGVYATKGPTSSQYFAPLPG